nr:helix-turn-helix domain-containing protein [Crocosphaera sp.]
MSDVNYIFTHAQSTIMILNYQYRCYPETPQKSQLNSWLRVCQYWYNWQIGDRFRWWDSNRTNYVVPSGDFCYISCSLPPLELRDQPTFYSQKKLLPEKKKDLTIDAVLFEDDYLATSEGKKLPSVKSYRNSQNELAKISQRKNAKKKGSKARRKLAKREAGKHQQIARARKDHAYKIAHSLVRSDKKVFFVENLNLRGLRKRNKTKKDHQGNYLPNGQGAKSGLNKSWSDASFGQFFDIFSYIAEKAGAVVKKVNPAYTSQLLCYRDEFVFTDCGIRKYWDEVEQIWVDRDISAAINLKRVGLELFPTIN